MSCFSFNEALNGTFPEGEKLAVANESLLHFGRVAHVAVGLEGSCLASVHPFFSTPSCSQLLGCWVVTLMHLERSHPTGGRDLAPV